MGGFMGQVERAEVSAYTEDKVRQRTTRLRTSVETNDGFLIGLDTGAWEIAQGENNDVIAHNKLDNIYDTILMVSVKFIDYIYFSIL